MGESKPLHENSYIIHGHIEVMQGIIQRMAENSRSCKVWCVTLVAATLVLVARTGEPRHALIALIPTLLFLFLDSYYLAFERAFIRSQNAFVAKIHQGDSSPVTDIYRIAPTGMGWLLVGRCLLGSMSILPFYVLITATVLVSWIWIL